MLTDPEKLHLVDGTFELYRAHYSKRPSQTATVGGRSMDVKATLGVVSSLLALFADETEGVTRFAIAFDNPIASFRNDLYAPYKSDAGVPAELRSQFDLVEEACSALGVRVLSMRELEADDALATLALRHVGSADQVRILTPDKDLGQVVRGSSIVQVDRIRKKVIDERGVFDARGVAPRQIPDFLALTGDAADGIPGVPGFGAKTAASLLAHFETLDAIPDSPTRWPANLRGRERLAPVLAGMRADAKLFKTLATLVTDATLPSTAWEELAVGELATRELDAFAHRMSSRTLAERARQVDATRAVRSERAVR